MKVHSLAAYQKWFPVSPSPRIWVRLRLLVGKACWSFFKVKKRLNVQQMTRLCHLASNPCTPTELNNVLRVPWWPPSICPVVHEKTRESFFSFSLLPFDDIFFFRPFCSNLLIASTRVRGDVSLSKSGEGNADDEWRSEEEMKVACRPGIYIFPRVTRLMIRLYAVARTRASRHFFQSGRRWWETARANCAFFHFPFVFFGRER